MTTRNELEQINFTELVNLAKGLGLKKVVGVKKTALIDAILELSAEKEKPAKAAKAPKEPKEKKEKTSKITSPITLRECEVGFIVRYGSSPITYTVLEKSETAVKIANQETGKGWKLSSERELSRTLELVAKVA